MSPFEIMFGTQPVEIPTAFPHINVPAAEEHISYIMRIREEALTAHQLAQEQMIEQVKGKILSFKEGDLVWLDSRNLKTIGQIRKFSPRREGLFKITKILGPVNVKLDLPPRWKIYPVFDVSLITPYCENEIHRLNFTKPPLDLIDNEEEFEIETIVSHQRKGNQWQFLIKWKGYPTSDNSWEYENNLEHSEETLNTYKDQHGVVPIINHTQNKQQNGKCTQ